jgi:hypothetical protein
LLEHEYHGFDPHGIYRPTGRDASMSSTSSSEASNTTSDRPSLFVRQATGLVREGKTHDAFFYNVMWSGGA